MVVLKLYTKSAMPDVQANTHYFNHTCMHTKQKPYTYTQTHVHTHSMTQRNTLKNTHHHITHKYTGTLHKPFSLLLVDKLTYVQAALAWRYYVQYVVPEEQNKQKIFQSTTTPTHDHKMLKCIYKMIHFR